MDAGRKAPSVAEACAQYLAAVFGPVDHAGAGAIDAVDAGEIWWCVLVWEGFLFAWGKG